MRRMFSYFKDVTGASLTLNANNQMDNSAYANRLIDTSTEREAPRGLWYEICIEIKGYLANNPGNYLGRKRAENFIVENNVYTETELPGQVIDAIKNGLGESRALRFAIIKAYNKATLFDLSFNAKIFSCLTQYIEPDKNAERKIDSKDIERAEGLMKKYVGKPAARLKEWVQFDIILGLGLSDTLQSDLKEVYEASFGEISPLSFKYAIAYTLKNYIEEKIGGNAGIEQANKLLNDWLSMTDAELEKAIRQFVVDGDGENLRTLLARALCYSYGSKKEMDNCTTTNKGLLSSVGTMLTQAIHNAAGPVPPVGRSPFTSFGTPRVKFGYPSSQDTNNTPAPSSSTNNLLC